MCRNYKFETCVATVFRGPPMVLDLARCADTFRRTFRRKGAAYGITVPIPRLQTTNFKIQLFADLGEVFSLSLYLQQHRAFRTCGANPNIFFVLVAVFEAG